MQLEVGAIVEGTVTSLTSFGAFVSLPDGKSGMVHISEVSSSYVKDIRDFLKEGQQVKVKVISVNEGKVSLSIKKAVEPTEEKPRQRSNERHHRQAPNVWQGQRQEPNSNASFEDMMARFKQVSDEKITDLKRAGGDSRHGGYSRRSRGQ